PNNVLTTVSYLMHNAELGGNIGYFAFTNIYAVYFFYLLADVGSGHPPAIHPCYSFFELIAHPLTFEDELGLKYAISVARNSRQDFLFLNFLL
ncbi:MAG TPA: hypothetical protein PKY76_11380, partial [Bacteroidales bacterium]|nr:hypothetical protein [Bacteroidales bacterium]